MSYPQRQTSPETTIIKFLSTVRSRMRFDASLKWLIFCSLISLFLFGILLGINRWIKLPFSALTFVATGLSVSLIIAALRFYLYRPKLFGIAQNLDLRLKLKERLSSAMEIIESPIQIQNEMAQFQIKDAALQAARLDPKTSYSYTFLKSFKPALIVALPFLVLPLLPHRSHSLSSDQIRINEEIRNVIRKQGSFLVDSAKNLESLQLRDSEISRISEEMTELGKRLKSGKPSKKEALKGISELSSQIQTEQEKIKGKNFSQTFDMLSKSLKSAGILEKNQADSPAQKLMELADKLDKSQIDPELRKKLELLLRELAAKLNASEASDELTRQLQALIGATGQPPLNSQPLNSEVLRKLAESLKRSERRQLEIEALQLMMAQLQKSKSKIAMEGLNLELDFDLESKVKLAKRQPSPGDESTNLQAIGGKTEASSPSDFNKSETMNHRQLEAKGKAEAEFKSNYAPTRLNQQGTELELEGEKSDSERNRNAIIYSRERPEATSFSFVPYQKVYHQYRSAADDAISKERIPIQYRNLIKAYFEAINPKER